MTTNHICKNCGKEFPYANTTRGIFCSRKCYLERRRTHPEEYRQTEYLSMTCSVCGKSFERRKHEAQNRNGTSFCSRQCSGKGTPHQGRARRESRIEQRCLQCKENFTRRASETTRKFCSDPCARKYRALHMSGKDNPNFRHGMSQNSAKWTAKKFFEQKCIICGFNVAVDIHHIIPKDDGGTNIPENLAVLCPNHHRMADMGLLAPSKLKIAVKKLLTTMR